MIARPARFAAAAIVLVALIWSRKPGVLLHAELWGDDGWSWYPDAYNRGLHCLVMPVNGYLNTLQRLVGLAAQPFPLAWAPTVFALAGLLVQVAPCLFLVSVRMQAAWPSLPARVAFASILAVLPNEIELYANLTNAQWHLALLAFLILAAAPPQSRRAAAFDTTILIITGLSGPFGLLLLPIAAWQWWQSRTRPILQRGAILAAAAAVQLCYLLTAPHGSRLHTPLGATPALLARILALQIPLGAELGFHVMRHIRDSAVWPGIAIPVALIAAALAAIALRRGPSILRQFALFAGLVLAAALISPQASATVPQWQALADPPTGNRYFTFADIAWIGSLFALTASRPTRLIGASLLAILIVCGIPGDWQALRFPKTDFQSRASRFATAPSGTRMEFPIIPPGLNPMVLVKK